MVKLRGMWLLGIQLIYLIQILVENERRGTH